MMEFYTAVKKNKLSNGYIWKTISNSKSQKQNKRVYYICNIKKIQNNLYIAYRFAHTSECMLRYERRIWNLDFKKIVVVASGEWEEKN